LVEEGGFAGVGQPEDEDVEGAVALEELAPH
jgi:hypothetical protein